MAPCRDTACRLTKTFLPIVYICLRGGIVALTFKKGIHLNEHKNTSGCHTVRIAAPEFLYIPMRQHIGAPVTCIVKEKDTVTRGQTIGTADKALGADVHSPVSGTVERIEYLADASGTRIQTVVIKNDGMMTPCPDLAGYEEIYGKSISEITAQELSHIVRKAGITGMGGASFPTHVKISSAAGRVSDIIINCAECEPYITADHRLMTEAPEKIVKGLEIIASALSLSGGTIAVEDNKRDAVKLLSEAAGQTPGIKVAVLRTKYPQGDERQLIRAVTGRRLPAGKLPADVGCVIFNAATCAAICDAVTLGTPLTERIVTVDGDCVEDPGNFIVPIGTPIRVLAEHCGIKKEKAVKKIISGGPMMGTAQYNADYPVVKGTSALLFMSCEDDRPDSLPSLCIRCGRCVNACPMNLMPLYLALYSKAEDYDNAIRYGVTSCIECGCCTYVCPGNVPIVQYIRIAKPRASAILKARSSQEGK